MKHEKFVDLIEELIESKICHIVEGKRHQEAGNNKSKNTDPNRIRKIKYQLVQLLNN